MTLKLAPKLALIFFLFAFVMLIGAGIEAYRLGRTALEAATVTELESTAGEKEAALDGWVSEREANIAALADSPYIQEELVIFLEAESGSAAAQKRLIRELAVSTGADQSFQTLFILSPKNGQVIISTDPQEVGAFRADRSYFIHGKEGLYTTPIYYSPFLQVPAMTTAAPLRSADGQLLGVLVGRLNLNELNTIIQRRSGLRETDDAFLVNTSNLFVSQPRFIPDPAVLHEGIHTEPVERCLNRETGTISAIDYRGVPVIAAYRWLPKHQMCLIVKLSQAEALAPLQEFVRVISWIAFGTLLMAALIALALSITLVRPIRAMQIAAQRYGRGDLEARLPETRHDELGVLAHEFNQMAGLLAEKELELLGYAQTLEKKVEERASALRESEEKFKYFFDHSFIGISITLLNGEMSVNNAFCEILGYSEAELTCKHWQEITHPDDIELSRRMMTIMLSGEKDSVRFTKRYLHKDSSVIWGDLSIALRRDDDGKPIYFMSALLDITERKRAEMQLADALSFTEHILTSSPIGIFTYQLSGECLSANAAAAEMVGATVEQLEHQNFRELQSWKRSGLFELAEQAIASKQPAASDVNVVTTFGKEAWYRAQFVTFQSAGEELLLMIFNDITERKHAEEALAASEKRFRAWIENSSDVVTVIDSSGIIQFESASLKRMLGYAPEELMGKNAFDFIHPDDVANISNIFQENIQNLDSTDSAEFRFRHHDGSWRTLEAVSRTYVDEHHEVVALINSRDITERKQAEKALQDSEARYRTLMEESLEAIYIYEADTKRILVANPALLKILGYTAEEVGDLTLYDIVANDRNSIDSYLEQVLKDDGISMGERLWKRKDGTTCPVEVTANKIQQDGKDLIFVVGRDITERKQAENALREKERLLSESQRIGLVGSVSYSILNDTFQLSDEMYHLLDISADKFRHNSQDFLALIYPSDRPSATKWIEDIKSGRQIGDLNYRIFRQNGELRYLHWKGAAEFNSDGKPIRFVGTLQDVTERKVAEIQINQQIKRLTALTEIDHAIISSSDQRYTLGIILSHVIAQLQVDAADICLVDTQEQIINDAISQGFRAKIMETECLRLDESLAGRVVMERRMIRIADLRERSKPPQVDTLVATEGFVSYIGVPLIIKGTVKGVLEVYQRTLLQPYQEWLDFLNTLAGQAAIAIENIGLLGDLQATNQELAQAYDATIEGWSRAMDLRDRETEGHTQRVTSLTLKLARALGIDDSQLVHIRRGVLLHDIGKLGVPDHILFKPGKFTPEEFEIMKQHTEFAYEMLVPIAYLKPALAIPYCHHERWDGSGYPLGLKGSQIPLEARIFAVVDVWDALQSNRTYRPAWSEEEAHTYLREQSGKQFDPEVVELFFEVIE